jgi:hypothetical protein
LVLLLSNGPRASLSAAKTTAPLKTVLCPLIALLGAGLFGYTPSARRLLLSLCLIFSPSKVKSTSTTAELPPQRRLCALLVATSLEKNCKLDDEPRSQLALFL